MSDVTQVAWSVTTQRFCPYCKCTEVYVREHRNQMCARCDNCGAQGPMVYAREISKHGLMWARAEAIQRWNRRAEDAHEPFPAHP